MSLLTPKMTTTGIILLKALNQKQFKPIKEIQTDLKLLGMNLNQKTIYARLEKLASKKLCHQKWQEGLKIYGLSKMGKRELDLFKTQLLA